MSSQMTVVQYFVPEDKDTQDKYNAFVVYKKRKYGNISLKYTSRSYSRNHIRRTKKYSKRIYH